MNATPPPPGEPWNGCAASVCIGVLTAWIVFASTGASSDWGFLVFYAVIIAAPFLVLTACGVTATVPWLVGCALTALFWGYLLVDAVFINPGGGANIGAGLVGLFWPFVVAGGALGAAKLTGSLPDPPN